MSIIDSPFPSLYLPPISWFVAYLKQGLSPIAIERYEHFPKQTYRNRAHIYSPNGLLSLSIPVVKGAKNHTQLKDVRISYADNWQKIHWKSLESAYRSSSFFEYYEADIRPFYERREEFLFDYNEGLIELMLKSFKIRKTHGYTESYQAPTDVDTDLRLVIHPKKTPIYTTGTYYQVFEDRAGFLPELSAIDLLFNHGNQALPIIRSAR